MILVKGDETNRAKHVKEFETEMCLNREVDEAERYNARKRGMDYPFFPRKYGEPIPSAADTIRLHA